MGGANSNSTGKIHSYLEKWQKEGPLHLRMQAWIVLRKLAQLSNAQLPLFPNPPLRQENAGTHLEQPIRQLMSTPAVQHGSIRFVDIHHSVESAIERVEHVTNANLSTVKSAAARKLDELLPDSPTAENWPNKIRCYGDTLCQPLRSNFILDDSFDDFLSGSPLPADLQCSFSQAFLGSENAWVLRASPIPDDNLQGWPREEELKDIDENPSKLKALKEKLLLLAARHRVSDDEIVVAARIQVFAWFSDFIFRLWWAESREDSTVASQKVCPTTMSGRTFAFDFSKWWEPNYSNGRRPLAFAVGGHQRLGICFPELMPAKMWRDLFWMATGNRQPVKVACQWRANRQIRASTRRATLHTSRALPPDLSWVVGLLKLVRGMRVSAPTGRSK